MVQSMAAHKTAMVADSTVPQTLAATAIPWGAAVVASAERHRHELIICRAVAVPTAGRATALEAATAAVHAVIAAIVGVRAVLAAAAAAAAASTVVAVASAVAAVASTVVVAADTINRTASAAQNFDSSLLHAGCCFWSQRTRGTAVHFTERDRERPHGMELWPGWCCLFFPSCLSTGSSGNNRLPSLRARPPMPLRRLSAHDCRC
jgi:hypothetical protein